jgi:hypothetical protein
MRQTSLPRDLWRHRKKFQAVQKSLCFPLFTGPEAGINFRDIDRATGQEVALLDEVIQVFSPPQPSIEMIQDDGCVQENGGHQRFWCFKADSKRSSLSDRI